MPIKRGRLWCRAHAKGENHDLAEAECVNLLLSRYGLEVTR